MSDREQAVALVGREQELTLIAAFLRRAAAEGGTLLFTGEPGVGKTVLLDAASEAARAVGVGVLRAAGSEFGTRVNFPGLAQLLWPLSAVQQADRRAPVPVPPDRGRAPVPDLSPARYHHARRPPRRARHPEMTVTSPRRSTMTENTTAAETDVITKLSHQSVADTVSKLTGMIAAKGMKLFGVIDQRAEARQAGLDLRETVLVIFGSPAAGTPVMAAVPLSALDLPLKVLVWSDDGQTKVSYYSPAALAARRHIGPDLAANLAGINGLTDALVAS
jgi:uncharacterized protein (DUF302 family)